MEMALQNLMQNAASGMAQQSGTAGKGKTDLDGGRGDFFSMLHEKYGQKDGGEELEMSGLAGVLVGNLLAETGMDHVFPDMQQISIPDSLIRGEQVKGLQSAGEPMPGVLAAAESQGMILQSTAAEGGAQPSVDGTLPVSAEGGDPTGRLTDEPGIRFANEGPAPASFAEPQTKQEGFSLEKQAPAELIHAEPAGQDVKAHVRADMPAGQGKTEAAEPAGEIQSMESAGQISGQTFPVNTADSQKTVAGQAGSAVRSASETEFVEHTAELLQKAVKSGRKEIEIQLEPAHLGKIIVKTVYESDKVSVVISCSTEKALSLLTEHAADLGKILQQNVGGGTAVLIDEHPQDPQGGWNPDDGGGDSRNQRDEQQQKKKESGAYDGDFLQQLRLGIV